MLLLLLCGMGLAWFLQKKLYQKSWQKNLKIQIGFQDSAIYEGEESTLKEVVVNDKPLPIPALDGGHIVFCLYEMITGRKPSDKFLTAAQIVGMFLLLLLMVLAFGNDIARLVR